MQNILEKWNERCIKTINEYNMAIFLLFFKLLTRKKGEKILLYQEIVVSLHQVLRKVK